MATWLIEEEKEGDHLATDRGNYEETQPNAVGTMVGQEKQNGKFSGREIITPRKSQLVVQRMRQNGITSQRYAERRRNQ